MVAATGGAIRGGGRPTPAGGGTPRTRRPRDTGPTIADYLTAFTRIPFWTDVLAWPPDVFALCNLVLDHTEAYRFAVSPVAGSRWPPTEDWNVRVAEAGQAWRAAVTAGTTPPKTVADEWETLRRQLDLPLAAIRNGTSPGVVTSLLTLHAMADEACSWVAQPDDTSRSGQFVRRAWRLLDKHGSLSTIDSTRVRITPKAHFASRGITIRSLSRYLALMYESIDVRWRRIRPRLGAGFDGSDYNLVLLPWPFEVRASDFREVEGSLENMDRSSFGFFEFCPSGGLDIDVLTRVVQAARRKVRRVDAVVLPESAVEPGDIPVVESVLSDMGVVFLITGVREPAGENGFGRNYVHLASHSSTGWQSYEQSKHHRWALDEAQIRQYHLTKELDPSRLWWEAIELPPRDLQVIDVGGGGITVPLVCEDLARMDEVADLLRRIGPGLVMALLLDGPQLQQRWSCRYASVLTEEPGSAVLTLTSFGMAARSTPPGESPSRSVAMWSDPTSGTHQLELGRGARGLLLTTSVDRRTQWTADGRRHDNNAPAIVLEQVHQLSVSATSVGAGTRVVQSGR